MLKLSLNFFSTKSNGYLVARISSDTYFFFSSRRRHTRFDCDWSSDVCSSDLRSPLTATIGLPSKVPPKSSTAILAAATERSEERRVGKEGRSWGSRYH